MEVWSFIIGGLFSFIGIFVGFSMGRLTIPNKTDDK